MTQKLQTARLELIPCSREVAQAVVTDKSMAAAILMAQVPGDWPAPDLLDFLPSYAQELETDPEMLGWGVWLIIHAATRTVIGDAEFKGRPAEKTVEIGYSVLSAYRQQGYATEATRALIDWAFAQGEATRIIAECLADNAPSIRILGKMGFQELESDGNMLKWELNATNPI